MDKDLANTNSVNTSFFRKSLAILAQQIRADLNIQESWIPLHLQGHLSCRAAGLAWSQNITAVMNGFPWVSNDSDHQLQSKEQSQVRWQTRILTHLQLNKTETCSLIKIFFEHHYAIMLYLHCLTSQDRI